MLWDIEAALDAPNIRAHPIPHPFLDVSEAIPDAVDQKPKQDVRLRGYCTLNPGIETLTAKSSPNPL
jgi:hypothetical protein